MATISENGDSRQTIYKGQQPNLFVVLCCTPEEIVPPDSGWSCLIKIEQVTESCTLHERLAVDMLLDLSFTGLDLTETADNRAKNGEAPAIPMSSLLQLVLSCDMRDPLLIMAHVMFNVCGVMSSMMFLQIPEIGRDKTEVYFLHVCTKQKDTESRESHQQNETAVGAFQWR